MRTDTENTYFDLASRYVQHTSQSVFLTGKAGTGKTTFLKHIQKYCTKKMAVVAPTGVAAINAGGVTLHTFFQLPIGAFLPGGIVPDSGDQLFNTRHTLLQKLRLTRAKRELIKELELVIIDEVSMLRADLLDAIDTVLRHIRKEPLKAFGGVQMLFIGDLFQLPPVVSEIEWSRLKEHYASPFFFEAQVLKQTAPVLLELKKIYRQREQLFIDLLHKIRNNQAESEDLQTLNSHYQPAFQPGLKEQVITLTTHNGRAEQINQQSLARLSGDPIRFSAEISGEFSEKAFPADEELLLKKGAQIMFIRNDKGEERRYYNGRLGVVEEVQDSSIHIRFEGEAGLLELEKETWRNIRYQYDAKKDSIEEEELGSFSQYPIRLAWAITIHKSQGLSFDKAIIDAGAAFAPGQVYVALSRLTNMEGLILKSRIGASAIQTDPRIHHFSAKEKPVEVLEAELAEGEQQFIRQSVLDGFRMDSLKAMADHQLQDADKRTNAPKLSRIEWALQFSEQVGQLLTVSVKTTRHLEQYTKPGEPGGYAQLSDRTNAAAQYFSNALQQVKKGLVDHITATKKVSGGGKYLGKLLELQAVITLREKLVGKSARLALALAEGKANTVLLEIIHEKPEPEPTIADKKSSKLADTGKAMHPAKKAGTNKGESHRTSLELFRTGKTIAEIANERALAVSTIANHLISFIASGELDARQMVEPEKLQHILSYLEVNDEQPLTKIKENLGEAYSYTEIKAAAGHATFLEKMKTTSEGKQ